MATRYVCPRCLFREKTFSGSLYSAKRLNTQRGKRFLNGSRSSGHDSRRNDSLAAGQGASEGREHDETKPLKDEKKSVLDVLEERGLVHDIAG